MFLGLVMEAPSLPFWYCFGGQIFQPDIFLNLFHTCVIGVLELSFDTYCVHDSLFFWVNNRRACAWVRLKDMRVSTLGPLPLWAFLSKAHLVFSISRHSSSNQGLHFLGIVVALGMLSFAASMTWATNEVRGSLLVWYRVLHDLGSIPEKNDQSMKWNSPPYSSRLRYRYNAEIDNPDIKILHFHLKWRFLLCTWLYICMFRSCCF